MAKVISFGDSFTWGSDMSDTYRADLNGFDPKKFNRQYRDMFSRHTWQALLAKEHNMDYDCHAREGCSNQTILREFLRHAEQFESDDIISVNFTWRDRYEFYIPGKLDSHPFYDDQYSYEFIRPHGTDNDSLNEIYYKYIQSSEWDISESLKAINLVISYLELNNFKYVITCIDDLIYKDPYHNTVYSNALKKMFEDKITWFDDKGLFQWCKDNNLPISEMWHPLEEAHKEAYRHLKDKGVFNGIT